MEIIEEKLLRYINEERGISNTVVQWSKIVIDVLQAKLKISKTLPISKDFVTFKKGEVLVDLTIIKLPVRWFYYNFMDSKTFEKNKDFIDEGEISNNSIIGIFIIVPLKLKSIV